MQSNEQDQVAMTHFTSQAAAAQTLDGWRHEILKQPSSSEKFGPKELSLRLYSRYGMNDPTELVHNPREVTGGIGSQREDGSRRSRLVFPDTAFIYCGSKEMENEALDRLDSWRAYGADGKGIAITTLWSKKGLGNDGLDILKVKYVFTDQLAENKIRCATLQTEIDNATKANHTEKAKALHKERMDLEVGYKVSDYQAENEIRIVYYAGDQSSVVPPILAFSAESGRLRAYVTRKVKVGIGQTLSGLYVTIGPRVPKYEASHWKMMADWTVRQLGLSGSRLTCQSELTYVG